MKKTTKALLLALCAVLLVAGTVMGTLAYLQDQDTVVNTFTVGKVDITLAETDVDGNGDNQANLYHLIPGKTYEKDPTVTVVKGSEESYVRMILTVHNASAVQAIINNTGDNVEDYADMLGGWDETVWQYEGYNYDSAAETIAFEFRYKTKVTPAADANSELEPLFETLIVPGTATGAQLAELYGENGEFKMVVQAHAIQAYGFANADAAWAAFAAEINA